MVCGESPAPKFRLSERSRRNVFTRSANSNRGGTGTVDETNRSQIMAQRPPHREHQALLAVALVGETEEELGAAQVQDVGEVCVDRFRRVVGRVSEWPGVASGWREKRIGTWASLCDSNDTTDPIHRNRAVERHVAWCPWRCGRWVRDMGGRVRRNQHEQEHTAIAPGWVNEGKLGPPDGEGDGRLPHVFGEVGVLLRWRIPALVVRNDEEEFLFPGGVPFGGHGLRVVKHHAF